ncbi:MAG: hypothetical protein WA738_05200 [Candidatus Angelobacter sp.]
MDFSVKYPSMATSSWTFPSADGNFADALNASISGWSVAMNIHFVHATGEEVVAELEIGQSYITEISFMVPAGTQNLRLLVSTVVVGPGRLMIGSEDSWFHQKTYFAIA